MEGWVSLGGVVNSGIRIVGLSVYLDMQYVYIYYTHPEIRIWLVDRWKSGKTSINKAVAVCREIKPCVGP